MDQIFRRKSDVGGCEDSVSDDFILSPKALVIVQGSSKGTQPKYYENGYWYKINTVGYEGVADFRSRARA